MHGFKVGHKFSLKLAELIVYVSHPFFPHSSRRQLALPLSSIFTPVGSKSSFSSVAAALSVPPSDLFLLLTRNQSILEHMISKQQALVQLWPNTKTDEPTIGALPSGGWFPPFSNKKYFTACFRCNVQCYISILHIYNPPLIFPSLGHFSM